MPLITTLPASNNPGTLVNTSASKVLTVRYANNLVAQVYTLDLNPITPSITPYSQYLCLVRGAQLTMIYQPGSGSALLDLTSQLTQHFNRSGYFWASITGSGVIRLTAREAGINNQLMLQSGLFGATLTQTTAPSSPIPLQAGTLLFWDTTYSANDPWASRLVTTLDVASVRPGFSVLRDCAGVSLRSSSNYGTSDLLDREFEIMRQGDVWVRNAGTSIITRSTPVTVNTTPGTPLLPSGSFNSSGLTISTVPIQYQSIASPNTNAILSLGLV